MYKRFLIVIVIFMYVQAYAQIAGGAPNINGLPDNIPSPNAAALGAYGQVPVNLFNGLPNISIPIYGQNGINIDLSYHASGVRPENHSGWVGTGWNLNTGGSITRIVNGGIDEAVSSYPSDIESYSYYSNPGFLDGTNWFSGNYIDVLFNSSKTFYTNLAQSPLLYGDRSNEDGFLHPSPDEFTFNFNGISGSFYYNHKGKWVVKSNQNIHLKINETLSDFDLDIYSPVTKLTTPKNIERIFYGFEITASDGTTYVFGKTKNSIEFSRSSFNSDPFNNQYVATTWNLTKIIQPNKKEIVFEYERNTNPVLKQSVSVNIYDLELITGELQAESNNYIRTLQQQFLVYLNKIKFDKGEVIFNKSLSTELEYDDVIQNGPYRKISEWTFDYTNLLHWHKLDNILINDIDGNRVNKIDFSYTQNPERRLFLQNVKKYGKTDLFNEKYSFKYNEVPLPRYNSEKLDHWGFYNGYSFFDNNAPENGFFYTKDQAIAYHTSRGPNANFMKAGILEEITYPTKGKTTFIYEPHNYSSTIIKQQEGAIFGLENKAHDNNAGGLRIKEIISNAFHPNSVPISKKYFYVKDYKNNDFRSSGILGGEPKYLEDVQLSGGVLTYWFWKSYSIEPMSYTNGNHVTYSKVVEKNADDSFVEYSYTNHDNSIYRDNRAYSVVFHNDEQWKHFPFNNKDLVRGKLLGEKYYSSDKKLVKEVVNTYTTVADNDDNTVRSFYITSRQFGEQKRSTGFAMVHPLSGVYFEHNMAAYETFKFYHYLDKTEETIYDSHGNNPITNTLQYTYNNYRALREKKSSVGNGEFITELNYYASDGNLIYDVTDAHIANKMFVNDNRIHEPIKTETFKVGNDGSEKKLASLGVVYDEFSEDETSIILPKKFQTSKSENNLEDEVVYYHYDNKGNPLEYSRVNGIHTVNIWGYNQEYLIAKIVNSTLSDVETVLGVSNMSLLNGNTLSDEQIRATIGLLRNHGSMSNSFVTTYTYNSLVGISSITDSKGEVTYYEYDDFNRLSYVRDDQNKILGKTEYHLKN